MAFPYEKVGESTLLGTKPESIPKFFGWYGKELEVPAKEYESRLQRTMQSMAEAPEPIDFLVVKSPEDIRWLTGFHTIGDSPPQTMVIPKVGEPFMVARLIEADLVHKYTWIGKVWTCPDVCDVTAVLFQALQSIFPSGDSNFVVGIQPDVISGTAYLRFVDFAKQWSGAKIVDASKAAESPRLLKSAFEVDCIKKAANMTAGAMTAGLNSIKVGVPLCDLQVVILQSMFSAGSEDPSYSPIVRTTDPSGHGGWEVNEKAGAGEMVFLEFAATVMGHHAPAMRTAYIMGPGESSPPVWLLEAEKLIQKVFDEVLPMMVPRARACDIDTAAHKILMSNSHGLVQSSRTGYTVGGTAVNPVGNAGWGDADFSLVGHNVAPLKEGMVFHFIPWFQKYKGPCTGPIGLSDTVMVTASGGQRMSSLPLQVTFLNEDGSKWESSQ
mmetsp:Transcript_89160/g.186313  ORF Transcript_89160/g.186313 Transcript_89160/m.186313 type:complete len:439 (+) Transcript_89160:48-1364(+)|eukprot:CAMPEP_0206459750 /NCGR_PEP_ID=MMETSP0324_2-20121206/24355_1 /ASSEMBLY_ACC=CAM_ASM_000836 /TAXON_ID=2866 /ORGANISM="Crypthecodinium cohnii, Strain Seligo" /LENGTH=438 /DNA_ID=CAMNT_0053931347 /DNA_START=49 /DNA_END=1365 /DNA_ORIENTATION=+